MRNWFLSSSTRLRPCSMKASNLAVNLAMRSRSSSNPKLMVGRVSASDCDGGGGRLVESEGSNTDAIFFLRFYERICSSFSSIRYTYRMSFDIPIYSKKFVVELRLGLRFVAKWLMFAPSSSRWGIINSHLFISSLPISWQKVSGKQGPTISRCTLTTVCTCNLAPPIRSGKERLPTSPIILDPGGAKQPCSSPSHPMD